MILAQILPNKCDNLWMQKHMYRGHRYCYLIAKTVE